MKIRIKKRRLKLFEIKKLSKETKKAADLGEIEPSTWKKFKTIYVAEWNNKIAGISVVVRLKNWIKIGPVFVLRKYRGKRIGSLLLKNIVEKNAKTNTYIGSSNLRIHKIINKYGFKPTSFFKLPKEVQEHLVLSLYDTYTPKYMLDSLFKKVRTGFKPFIYFTRSKVKITQ